MTLNEQLEAVRLEAGLTQAELSEKTGISQPHISNLEVGRFEPTLKTLQTLVSALGARFRYDNEGLIIEREEK